MAFIIVTFSNPGNAETLQVGGYDSVEIVGNVLRVDGEIDLAVRQALEGPVILGGRTITEVWCVSTVLGESHYADAKFEPRNSD
jgi:hypothetical protein